jgi:hypothetical protein
MMAVSPPSSTTMSLESSRVNYQGSAIVSFVGETVHASAAALTLPLSISQLTRAGASLLLSNRSEGSLRAELLIAGTSNPEIAPLMDDRKMLRNCRRP